MVTLEQLLGVEKAPPLLLVKEVATAMRQDPSTVRRHCEAKKHYPHAFKVPAVASKLEDGEWRIPAEDVRTCLRNAELTGEYSA